MNSAFERFTRIKKENVVRKYNSTLLPNFETHLIVAFGNVALTEEEIIYENYSFELDRWYTLLAFSTKKGQLSTIFMDLTDHKKFEKTIQESEVRFRKMFSEHDVPMFLTDPKCTNIVDDNSGAANYYGYPNGKLYSMKFGERTLSFEELHKIIDN